MTIPTQFMAFAWLAWFSTMAAAMAPDAADIMTKNFYASKITDLSRNTTMQLISESNQVRERSSMVLSKLQDNHTDSKVIITFSYPEDIRGTSFLQIEHADGDDELWISLPALNKTRRLVANNKKDSFVGSDFFYGDILLPKVNDYKHTVVREEKLDGNDCYVIESVPASDAVKEASGYGRKILWIRKDNAFEVKVEYYDIYGKLLKTQLVSDIIPARDSQNRWLALKREMINHQTKHRTILKVENWTTEKPLADDLFTIKSIE